VCACVCGVRMRVCVFGMVWCALYRIMSSSASYSTVSANCFCPN